MERTIEFLRSHLEREKFVNVLEFFANKLKDYKEEKKDILDAVKILVTSYGIMTSFYTLIDSNKDAKFWSGVTLLANALWEMCLSKDWNYEEALNFLERVINEEKDKKRMVEEMVNQ
jgi:hypothetical protein